MYLSYGNALKHPYESGYSIFRRSIIANPTLNLNSITKILKTNNEFDYSLINSLIKRNYSIDESKYNSLNFPTPNITNEPIQSHCPICAMQCYHSDLYRLPWITQCPIHKTPLIDHCPYCNKLWPHIKDIAKRDCPCCGKLINYSKLQNNASHKQTSLYKPIINLYKFIKYNDKAEQHLSYYGSIFNDRDIWPSQQNKLFPSYQIHKHPLYTKNYLTKLGVTTTNIYCKHFKIYKEPNTNRLSDRDGLYDKKYNWIANERIKALENIAKCIKASTPHSHKLEIYDFALISENNLKDSMPLCPYCVAFSLWYYRITGSPYKYTNKTKNPFSYLIEKDSTYKYFRPEPRDSYRYKNKYYTTSLRFQKWLYQRDLQSCFIKIFNYCNSIINSYNIDNNFVFQKSDIWISTLSLFDRYYDETIYCYVDPDEMKIHACFPFQSILDRNTLPKIKGTVKNCNNFKKNLKYNFIIAALKHNNISPPCNNGLNHGEYTTLLHGYKNSLV